MKRVIIVVFLVGLAGLAGFVRQEVASSSGPQVTARVQREFEAIAGSRLEIRGINGSVRILTVQSPKITVDIKLDGRQGTNLNDAVDVTQTGNTVLITGRRRSSGLFARWFGRVVKEELTVSIPKEMDVRVAGLNGSLEIQESTGKLSVGGVRGAVTLRSLSGETEISGINGDVYAGLKDVSPNGVRIRGVNGAVELKFARGLNADFTAAGIRGEVESFDPTIAVGREGQRSGATGKIGAGGADIQVSGVNGNISLLSDLTVTKSAE